MRDENKTIKKEDLLQLVSFNLGSEEFGIEILKVQEIIKPTVITRLPNAPVFIEGILNLRGRVIPVIDLRTRMGMLKSESDNSTRIVIVDVETTTVGFIVDSVNEVLRVPSGIIEPPPTIFKNDHSEFITGVGKLEGRLLLLLDINRILSADEKEVLNDQTESMLEPQ